MRPVKTVEKAGQDLESARGVRRTHNNITQHPAPAPPISGTIEAILSLYHCADTWPLSLCFAGDAPNTIKTTSQNVPDNDQQQGGQSPHLKKAARGVHVYAYILFIYIHIYAAGFKVLSTWVKCKPRVNLGQHMMCERSVTSQTNNRLT